MVSQVNQDSKLSQFKQKAVEITQLPASIYSHFTSLVRAGNEVLQPFSATARSFGRVLIPFRGASVVVGVPFDISNIVHGVQSFIKAPKSCKIFPVAQIGMSLGNILDNTVASVGIFENVGMVAARNASIVSISLGGVAIALQGLGIGLSAWTINKVEKIEVQFNRILGKNPTIVEHKQALKYLIKRYDLDNGKVSKGQFKRDFLGLFSEKQKAKIGEILSKDDVSLDALEKTNALLKKHLFHRKLKESLTIAISIIGIVGVVLLLFSPAGVAPVAWGILAFVGAGTLGTLAYQFAYNRKLNKALFKIFPKEPLYPYINLSLPQYPENLSRASFTHENPETLSKLPLYPQI